jgi:hypothetical protein
MVEARCGSLSPSWVITAVGCLFKLAARARTLEPAHMTISAYSMAAFSLLNAARVIAYCNPHQR